jgi:hypothetical protein
VRRLTSKALITHQWKFLLLSFWCVFNRAADFDHTDDKILLELGDAAGYSDEEKPRFVSGLRCVLQELRNNKTKDFQTIAASIAAYRTEFLGDPSRVLLLGGITV